MLLEHAFALGFAKQIHVQELLLDLGRRLGLLALLNLVRRVDLLLEQFIPHNYKYEIIRIMQATSF